VIRVGRERGAQDESRIIRRFNDDSHRLCQHDFSVDPLLQILGTECAALEHVSARAA